VYSSGDVFQSNGVVDTNPVFSMANSLYTLTLTMEASPSPPPAPSSPKTIEWSAYVPVPTNRTPCSNGIGGWPSWPT
jgi:hypothetical protein